MSLSTTSIQSTDAYLAHRTADDLMLEYQFGDHAITQCVSWIDRFLDDHGGKSSSHNLRNYSWTKQAMKHWMAQIAFHNALRLIVERNDDHLWAPRFDERTAIYRDELALLAYLPLRDVLTEALPLMTQASILRLTLHPQIIRGWREAQKRATAFLTVAESVAA